MELSLETLQQAKGFSGAPVKRQVTWTNTEGEEFTADVWVRKLSYHTAVSDLRSPINNSDPVAGRIALSIVNEVGVPVFRPSDITGLEEDGTPVMTKDADGNDIERGALDPALTFALLTLISEVNEMGKRNAPSLSQKKSSGTN